MKGRRGMLSESLAANAIIRSSASLSDEFIGFPVIRPTILEPSPVISYTAYFLGIVVRNGIVE